MTHPVPISPRPGQESVWDYPRPPRLEPVAEPLRVEFAGEVIAAADSAFRVLETSHPPVYYLPPDAVRREFLVAASGHSFCEFKGIAQYWNLDVRGARSERAAWSYPQPTTAAFSSIRNCFAFYASRVDGCYVAGERVQAQEGDFYGGWISRRIVGPFKGAPGTMTW